MELNREAILRKTYLIHPFNLICDVPLPVPTMDEQTCSFVH